MVFKQAMPNRLAHESSPYLLQHKNNPVDWYPWGAEALGRARQENLPILLSIGYSACHWCHVMEHESFENVEIAQLMNKNFVCIKVDREERPDLDHIYQNVAQAMTRSGGWPLTVFLTPELKPYFGGTYFPPEDRWGRPGFPRLLTALSDAYRGDPASVTENADKLLEFIKSTEEGPQNPQERLPDALSLEKTSEMLLSQVDWSHGGLGGAPKFPNPMQLDFLWRHGLATQKDTAIEAVLLTLEKMACGGIYDQLGGGFHRYSVDETWSVPHFEKMLYDNGLLLRTYSQVLLSSEEDAAGTPRLASLNPEKRALFIRVVEETVQYILREMVSPEGAFYSAQDADSEGEEGKFFAWDPTEVSRHLSAGEARAFEGRYGVTQNGNFEHGQTVLFLNPGLPDTRPETEELILSAKKKLLQARSKRIAPQTDDKVLASWNGLMISGLAWASQALKSNGREASASLAWGAAEKAFQFVLSGMTRPGDRLWSTSKKSVSKNNAYLDDYAFMSMAAIDLARFSESASDTYLEQAERWLRVVLEHFKTESGVGYYFTSDDHEQLIQRPKTLYDQAIPSGTAVVLNCLLVLSEVTSGEQAQAWDREVRAVMSKVFPSVAASPYGHGELINAALLAVMGPIVVSGTETVPLVKHPHVFRKFAAERLVCHRRTCSLQLKPDEASEKLSEKLKEEMSHCLILS